LHAVIPKIGMGIFRGSLLVNHHNT